MPYRYEAFNREGQRIRGALDVDSEAKAQQMLWDNDLTVISLKKASKPFALHEQLPSFFGVRGGEVIAFTNQLALLLESGINIYSALQIIREQSGGAMREVISSVVSEIGAGNTFAQSCAKHPLVFPPLFLRLTKVGEETGRLDTMLRRVAGYMEKQSAASSKVKSSLAYPIFVLATAAMALYILLAVALPNLIGLFKEFKAELPLVTRLIITAANLTGEYGSLGALALGTLVVLFLFYSRSASGKRNIDHWLVAAPVIGPIVIKLNLARFCDTIANLIGAGIPLSDALDLVVDIVHNAALQGPLREVRHDAFSGSSLSEAMTRYSIFPKMMVGLVRVAEETGTLETTFATLGKMYGDDADRSVGRLIAMLEPALTIFIGFAIGLVAIAIISTIYSIMPQIK